MEVFIQAKIDVHRAKKEAFISAVQIMEVFKEAIVQEGTRVSVSQQLATTATRDESPAKLVLKGIITNYSGEFVSMTKREVNPNIALHRPRRLVHTTNRRPRQRDKVPTRHIRT